MFFNLKIWDTDVRGVQTGKTDLTNEIISD